MVARHHFIPRFYLEGFIDPTNEPYLWIYDKESDEIRKASTRDAGLRSHFYSYPKKGGTRDSDSFEKAVSSIESQAAPLFQKIIRREQLNNDERSVMSFFRALTITRVPSFREKLHQHAAEVMRVVARKFVLNEEIQKSVQAEFEGKGESASINNIKEAARLMREGKMDVEVLPHYSLPHILELAMELAPLIHQMNWIYIVAHGSYRFATSDNPVVYVDPKHDPESPMGVGLGNQNIEVSFPISRDLALLAGWKELGREYQKGTDARVRNINYRTIANAERFVYASERNGGLAKLVRRHKESAPKVSIKTVDVPSGKIIAATNNQPSFEEIPLAK
jgi:hypothetical protein